MIKIVQRTSSQLTLRAYPYSIWLSGVLLVAAGVIMNPAFNNQVLGVMSIIGLVMIASMGHITTCELDKLSGRFTLKRRGLLNQTAIEYPLHHIQGMRITSRKARKHNSTSYQLNFVLASEVLVPFEAFSTSDYSNQEAAAKTICTFLGLGWSEGTSCSMGGLNFLKFLTMTLKMAGQRDSAIAKYQEKIRLNPDDINAHSQLAIALTLHGKHKEAQLILEPLREHLLAQGKTKKTEQIKQFLEGLDILNFLVFIHKSIWK